MILFAVGAAGNPDRPQALYEVLAEHGCTVTEGAGHFSFMDLPPPGKVEPLHNKQEFLRQYASAGHTFLLG